MYIHKSSSCSQFNAAARSTRTLIVGCQLLYLYIHAHADTNIHCTYHKHTAEVITCLAEHCPLMKMSCECMYVSCDHPEGNYIYRNLVGTHTACDHTTHFSTAVTTEPGAILYMVLQIQTNKDDRTKDVCGVTKDSCTHTHI